jgi:hypothetical protein
LTGHEQQYADGDVRHHCGQAAQEAGLGQNQTGCHHAADRLAHGVGEPGPADLADRRQHGVEGEQQPDDAGREVGVLGDPERRAHEKHRVV